MTNLHEDPQLCGIQFNVLTTGEILFGRKNGNPKPQIILGAPGIKPNHASIKLQPNGLFEFQISDAEAVKNTFINGEAIKNARRSRILNHNDRIGLPGGFIYLFRYPLLKTLINARVATIPATESNVLPEILAFEQIKKEGIPDVSVENVTSMTATEYTQEQIAAD